MHYAFMTFSTPQLTADQIIRLAQELGYDAVEPRIQADHQHGLELDTPPAQRAELRRQFEEAGVALCCIATSCRYADPETVKEMVEDTRRAITLAHDAGVPQLRVFGGKIGGGLSRQAAVEQVANALRSVADEAQAAGVTLCLETHDDWCDPAHVAAVMRQADHPAVAVNWDIMHPVRTAKATMEQAFETLRPWIRHVHVHDGDDIDSKLTMLPIGQGIVDHKAALRCLQQMEYDGYISGEWINWEPYEVHLPRELATLKQYEREISIAD